MARRHSFAQPSSQSADDASPVPLGDSGSAVMWYLSQFSRLALKAHNSKFVCRQGGDGALNASFMHSRQAWLKKNQEVFEIEWHSTLGNEVFSRVRSNSHPHLHHHHNHNQRQPLITSLASSRSREADISPYFALRADNGRYWRVTYPEGLLMATGEASNEPPLTASGEGLMASGRSERAAGGDDGAAVGERVSGGKLVRGRTDEELFTIEVLHANMFTIRNKATGTFVEVREDGSLRCDPSAALQLTIKDAQLFQLAVKVAFKTAQGLFVSVLPNGGLAPSSKRLSRKCVFIIQLGPMNTCTIATTKKRCWRVGKKGVVAADGKSTNEPSKEEFFTIDCPYNGFGVGWTIRASSNLLYLRPEGNKRLVADGEYTAAPPPQDPNCYFSLIFPEKGEAEEEEVSSVAEDRKRHTISESGGVKKLRRIIEAFEMRTEDLPLEDQKDPEYHLLEGERVVLLKHHLLAFHRCEAALGTAIITNYRLAFCPDDPKAKEKGAHCFSFPLTIINKITKIAPITTEAGNYRCLHIVLKDFRSYYFGSIPFTPIRKPKMDTFYQVLEDHTFPTRLSDFFAFAHRSALAAEAECPKVHARPHEYSQAVRQAIAEPRLTSWKAESPLILFGDGFALADGSDPFAARRYPRVGRVRHAASYGGRERRVKEPTAVVGDAATPAAPSEGPEGKEGTETETAGGGKGQAVPKKEGHAKGQERSRSMRADPVLGQLKNELFGMASQSPVNDPLFSKEVEAKWAATKAASAAEAKDKETDKLLSSPFLSSRTIAPNGWALYAPADDYSRLALDVSPWRVSPINWEYTLCETYPRLLVVPASMNDDDIQQVKQFRSKGRIPVPTWRHKESGSIIVRCSQPKTGLLSDRSEQDEMLVSSIRQACGVRCTVHLIDARPRVNAVMNTLTGAGVENAAVYNIHHANRLFLGIPNIHVVRDSGSRLAKIIDTWNLTAPLSDKSDSMNGLQDPTQAGLDSNGTSDHAKLTQAELRLLDKVLDTGWLDHITALLSGAVGISNLILESSSTGVPVAIIVHCSDGWDRTPQLVALAQLLLDPHYRTIHGFELLIEKEFLSFGHRFQDRCSHHGKKVKDQRSPIFHQFLECAWQLLQQFPSAFEFNEFFLETVLEHVYSCRYGTFLLNSEKERMDSQLADKTCSLWTFVNGFESDDEADDGTGEIPEGACLDRPLRLPNSAPKEEGPAPSSTTATATATATGKGKEGPAKQDNGEDEDEGDEGRGLDWDAIVRRRRKYVNPRYIHGRHHHLMPVINLSSPPLRKGSGSSSDQTTGSRRNSVADEDSQENAGGGGGVAGAVAGARIKSSSSAQKRSPSSRGSQTAAAAASGDLGHGSDEEAADSGGQDPDDDFEAIDGEDADLLPKPPSTTPAETGSGDQATREKAKAGGGLTGLGREDVEEMLEYLGNKWRRAGIGLYHAAIDRTRGSGPEAGSIRFWAALYLRWRRGDVLFPSPLPVAFLSPASLPASPALVDAPATAVVASAPAEPPSTAASADTPVGSPSSPKHRLRRSASSAPALSSGRYSAPVASSPTPAVSLASTLSGGSAVYSRKNWTTIMPLQAWVQLGELKRTATKMTADATLFSLSHSSRAD